ncbi:hypothetical protein H5410_040934 [Solanum commersonii]|uniref:Uncharacterized protein n=1 Tax=Solanum commersonii TaxID=4109 RepID=A0A9J5XSZ7_SOLCO|nr:hypothetical protein H5410_040934 [Solanum commersonii]
MKIRAARLASEDRFWSGTTLCSLRETLDSSCGIWLKMILGVGPTFHRYELQMEISPSPGEAFGDRSERKRSGTVSWSTRDRLSGRLWFSLVRLSMLRHLFIDLLEYGGVRVSSMLNFYNSCLRPYFGKVLGYDSMSLDIIEYPYLNFSASFERSSCRRYSGLESIVLTHYWILPRRFGVYEGRTKMIIYGNRCGDIFPRRMVGY